MFGDLTIIALKSPEQENISWVSCRLDVRKHRPDTQDRFKEKFEQRRVGLAQENNS